MIITRIHQTLKFNSTRFLIQSYSENQSKFFSAKQILNMPLIDPVTSSAGGDKTAEWQKKLVGKKLGDTSNEVVSLICRTLIID